MKIIVFEECNIIFAENQPEYLPLPAHKTIDGIVTSCWGLSFVERLKVVLMGRFYLQVLTFNQSLQPVLLSVDKPVLSEE